MLPDLPLPHDLALRAHVYAPARHDAWYALLAPEEQARVATFGHPRRVKEFIMGRAAARSLLAEALGLPPADVPLAIDEGGAIDVVGAALNVSITHKDDRAVAGIGPGTFGIDLERIAPQPERMHRRIFRPDERPHLDALPLPPEEVFALGWSCKEAVMKALRTGFRLPPKAIRLEVDLPAARATAYVDDGAAWPLVFTTWDAYYFAVAYEPFE